MREAPAIAAQIIITIVPIVGIVMGSVVAFFYLLWHHKRTVLLIQKGMYVPPVFDLLGFSLIAGLLLSSTGIVLTIFLGVLEGFGYGVLGGVIPLALGISLLAYYGLRRGDRHG